MPFNFSSADPEESKRKLETIRDIFQEAANKSVTKAQPLYQNITDGFNNFLNKGDSIQQSTNMQDAMKALQPMLTGLTTNIQSIQKMAMTDFSVAAEFKDVMTKFQEELKPTKNASSPAPRIKRPAPKNPGKGNFKF